ncbi:DUF4097 family beta strand repeat-containing protein [Streptomyces sp. NPDC001889]
MTESTWEVTEPGKLTFDEPVTALPAVTALRVRVVSGTVNVVGTDEGPARLEVSRLQGPPLIVTRKGGALGVTHGELPWKEWTKLLDRAEWRREATVTLTVPSSWAVEIHAVGAGVVVSGIRGRTSVRSVSGDATLMGLSGEVSAETVSGNVEAQSVTGGLRCHSVSGDLTVMEGGVGSRVRAESLTGDMLIDLAADGAPGAPADIRLTTVSGEVAVRLPHPADARVEANTASGSLSNAFDSLKVSGTWGSKRLTGRLGAGTGTLRATTVSGSIALLRRPPAEDPGTPGPSDDAPGPAPAPDGDSPDTPGTAGPAGPADPAGPSGKVL